MAASGVERAAQQLKTAGGSVSAADWGTMVRCEAFDGPNVFARAGSFVPVPVARVSWASKVW